MIVHATPANATPLTGQLLEIYTLLATRRYGLSAVHQLQHALQAATLAQRAGEPPAMIIAALLHDIGHMIHGLGENPAAEGVDDRHEVAGADWLAQHFGPAVSEPVRLHVPAKRYLVATQPGYAQALSSDSVRSLALQGGPMSPAEITEFDRLPFADDAKRLRRFDEAAKDPHAVTPTFDSFLPLVLTCQR
jgi:phosphonate degradation associated HDIG domain protein